MNGPSRIAPRGFTLVEMVITLTVFVLLSAAIFGIISGVLESAGSLQDNQNRGDQAMALQAFFRRQLAGLPATGVVASYKRGDSEGLEQNGIFFGSSEYLTAVDAKVQANGLYTFRTTTLLPGAGANSNPAAFLQLLTTDDPSLSWRPLVHDVKDVSWKFQASGASSWIDHWESPSGKPNMIEFSVLIAGDLRPTVTDVWLPPLVTPPVASPTAPPTVP